MEYEYPSLNRFVKRSNSCVRRVKLSIVNSQVCDLEHNKNLIVDQIERIQKLADRGDSFEPQRAMALVDCYDDLEHLYSMDGVSETTSGIPLDENVSEEDVLR